MRKLMMGCIPGMRTLVNTTEPHYSPELMNTPITLTVGASYSISWTGAKPTTSSHYIYPFCIYVYGGASGFFDMCDVRIKKVDSSGSSGYINISIVARMFGTDIFNDIVGFPSTININLEIRFTVTDVTEKDGITVYTVTAGIYMYGNKIMEKSDIKNTMDIGDGLKYYYNLEGTFVIKKLS